MIPKAIELVTKDDILRLIDNAVPEGRTIEYKRDLPGAGDADKVKFLKAVTGMANTDGGDLIYGIDAGDGVPTAAPGFPISQADQAKLRLESMLQACVEPRVPSVVLQTVPVDAGNCLLVVRTRRSWLAPHRITVGNHVQFYGRNSASTYPLDVSQLREAFLMSEQQADRVRAFVVDRLLRIEQGKTPVQLGPGARMVLHILPIASLSQRAAQRLDVPRMERTSFPIFADGSRCQKPNLDGFVLSDSRRDDCLCYTQVFRSGAVEAVVAFGALTGDTRLLMGGFVEQLAMRVMEDVTAQLHVRGMPAPYVISLSFVDVAGYALESRHMRHHVQVCYKEEVLILPDLLLETPEAFEPWTVMRPIFDALWNAFEYDGSPHYGPDGRWQG